MRVIALATLLALSAGTANAGDWRWVGQNEDVTLGYDRQTLSIEGQLRTAWVVTVYPVERAIMGHAIDYRVDKRVFDCRARTQALRFISGYKLAGGTHEFAESMVAPPIEIVPDTIGDGLLIAICSADDAQAGERTSRDFAVGVRGFTEST